MTYLLLHALSDAQRIAALDRGATELSTSQRRAEATDELVIVTRRPWDAMRENEITLKAWHRAGRKTRIVPLSEWLDPKPRVTRPPPVVADLGALTVEIHAPEPAHKPAHKPTPDRPKPPLPFPGQDHHQPAKLYQYNVAERCGWKDAGFVKRHTYRCDLCGDSVSERAMRTGDAWAHYGCLKTARDDLAAIPMLVAGRTLDTVAARRANRLVLGGRLTFSVINRKSVLAEVQS